MEKLQLRQQQENKVEKQDSASLPNDFLRIMTQRHLRIFLQDQIWKILYWDTPWMKNGENEGSWGAELALTEG